jgi:hypothetical protein
MIKITKAGYVYRDGKRASTIRVSPLTISDLPIDVRDDARKWAAKHYRMVNP